jgi:hypothetical protein
LGPLGIVARPSAGMLLRELGLPMDTFSAVLEAVQQGRWRTARNPKAYVKTVARREFKKMAPPIADRETTLWETRPQPGAS